MRADGKQFIAVDQSGMAGSTNFTRVWQMDKKEPLVELLGHRGLVVTAAFLPGDRAVTRGRGGTLRVWDLEDGGQELHDRGLIGRRRRPASRCACSVTGSQAKRCTNVTAPVRVALKPSLLAMRR